MDAVNQLNDMIKHPFESMAQYVDRGRTLQNALQGAGSQTTEADIVEALLMGLPKAYDVTRSVLLAQDTSQMTLATLRTRLQQCEAEDEREGTEDVQALYAKLKKQKGYNRRSNGMADIDCHFCGRLGHIARHCAEKKKKKREIADREASVAM